jgi:hypothetical protein
MSSKAQAASRHPAALVDPVFMDSDRTEVLQRQDPA